MTGGLSFLAGYTWSHSIDTASRGSGGSWHQDAYEGCAMTAAIPTSTCASV